MASASATATAAPVARSGSVSEFVRLHAAQFEAMGLPRHLWPVVHRKVTNEIFDASDSFRVEYVEGNGADAGFRLCVDTVNGLKAGADVWLIEHFWTTTEALAKPMLAQHPTLLPKLWEMIDMDRRIAEEAKRKAKAPAAVKPTALAADPAREAKVKALASEGPGALSPSDVKAMTTTITAVTGASEDAATAALLQSDYDLIGAAMLLTADDAATAALEKEVTRAVEQSITPQTAAAAAKRSADAKANADANAGAVAAAHGAGGGAADAKIDRLYEALFRTGQFGSYLIAAASAQTGATVGVAAQDVTQCLFVMDQIGAAIRPATRAPNATDGKGAANVPGANSQCKVLCLVNIPDTAYSLLWLTRDLPRDGIVTRTFQPVVLYHNTAGGSAATAAADSDPVGPDAAAANAAGVFALGPVTKGGGGSGEGAGGKPA